MKRAITGILLVAVLFGGPACRTMSTVFGPGRTCIVLSVGGAKGVAHIGALDAVKKSGLQVDCVFGNSMGAVIGALYAQNPQGDLADSYRRVLASYVKRTQKDAVVPALAGLIVGMAVILSEGKLDVETLMRDLQASGLNVAFFREFDNDRFRRVLQEYFHQMRVEDLPVKYATSYQKKSGDGLDLVVADEGDLATAVSRSSNNPFIFQGTNLTYVDPGADRASAVPVEEACRLFRPVRIIAINVTGKKAYYSSDMDCQLKEIMIQTGEVDVEVIRGTGPAFEAVYKEAYETTLGAIGTAPAKTSSERPTAAR